MPECCRRAAARGHENIIGCFLRNGADVASVDSDGCTPLHLVSAIDCHNMLPCSWNFPCNASPRFAVYDLVGTLSA